MVEGAKIRVYLSAIFFTVFLGILIAGACSASVTPMLSYQGRLLDSAGKPVADSTYNLRFYLFSAATEGSSVWTEPASGTRQVTTKAGLFTVILGATVPLPASAFQGNTWLETDQNAMILSTDATERMPIDSSGNVGIGTSTPSTALDVAGDPHVTGYTPEARFARSAPRRRRDWFNHKKNRAVLRTSVLAVSLF